MKIKLLLITIIFLIIEIYCFATMSDFDFGRAFIEIFVFILYIFYWIIQVLFWTGVFKLGI